MSLSFRTAVTVLASLASASVAPAQVVSGNLSPVAAAASSELASNEVPEMVSPTLISPSTDPARVDQDVSDNNQNTNDNNKVPGESLTAMVTRLRSSEATTHERECLATAIYFESKSEPLAGQLAVGEVLANRTTSGRFASSYCGVVMQRGQFSFIRNHRLPSVPRSGQQWKNAVAIATIVDSGMMRSAAPKALFFHAKRVSPAWHATRVATIGNHIFYR
ncbi:cell wall hydrolase [Sphingomonas sp.]|uniref:cell wall hydrolase n=1 Tax=Sphingomonas sp. TaxID=28214 RepID=UPI00286AC1C4|nr:cell wall hydrolase [Sphingomonas sp.]